MVGIVGKDVLLRCNAGSPIPEDADVLWRDKNDNPVLTIKNNEHTFIAERFRDRLSQSTDEYKKGNFSVTIMKLQLDDANMYECNIPFRDIILRVNLQVTGEITK